MGVAEQAQELVTTGNLLLAMPVAAVAGFISFASPCVLPLVPGYLSYVSGVSGQDLAQGRRQAGRVLGGVALFVVGYSLVFVALGATLGALTAWLFAHHQLITRSAGAIVIALGLFLAGVVRPAFLYRSGGCGPSGSPPAWPARCRWAWSSGSAGRRASARRWGRCWG
jgi:cytochrome c-type biogenesis protein